MGRQVTAELKDLLKHGCTIVPNSRTFVNTFWDEIYQKEVTEEEVWNYCVVVIPGASGVTSDAADCLTFDCRNKETSAYGWVEYWLIENNIPYVAG